MSGHFDSPFEVCPVCDEYVLLDQSHRECAREHHCEHVKCPLARYFVGKEMKEETDDASDEHR